MCDPISDSQKVNPLTEFSKKEKYKINIISFEKKNDLNSRRIKLLEKKFKLLKINWFKLPFYNNIFLRLLIFFYAEVLIFFIILWKHINIIHVWSYIPMMLVIFPNFFLRKKVVFDIRGFWFDEKKDFKQINLISYKILKKVEKTLFDSADRIITLSKKSIKIIQKNFNIKKKNIYFVTTFANKKIFKVIKFKNKKNFNFLYLGSATNSYDFKKIIKFLELFNKFDSNWKFNAYSKDIKHINKKISESTLNKNKFKVSMMSVDKIKKILHKFNFAIYFIKPTFAKKASCPTKLAEFMFSGLPIITNKGVGDIEYFKKESNIILFNFNKINEKNIKKNIKNLLKFKQNPQVFKQRKFAEKFFDEQIYFKKIVSIYQNI